MRLSKAIARASDCFFTKPFGLAYVQDQEDFSSLQFSLGLGYVDLTRNQLKPQFLDSIVSSFLQLINNCTLDKLFNSPALLVHVVCISQLVHQPSSKNENGKK
ncbi:hypothetical protein ACH5RR_023339 [Cinchona calisaya]|uniref:Uncharacterized protein n=1 Tax=Cinchona calisaya TaxID=153742 RepID=A0ABD2ZEA1_9GENT